MPADLEHFGTRISQRTGKRYWTSYCRECQRAKSRAYGKTAKAAEARRRRYREARADPVLDERWRKKDTRRTRNWLQKMRVERPEQYAEYLKYHREWQRERRAKLSEKELKAEKELRRIDDTIRRRDRGVREVIGRRRLHAVDEEQSPRLPIGPFRAFLRRRLKYYHGRTEVLADAIGMNPRVVYRFLHESVEVHLDVVDRALTHEGSTFLAELYPELYEEAVA